MRVDVRGDIVVVGRNEEAAELGNPNGFVYGEQYYVVATTDSGYRFAGPSLKDKPSAEEANMLSRTLEAFIQAGQLAPEKDWMPMEPVYGSAAYVAEGCEEERAWEERNRESW